MSAELRETPATSSLGSREGPAERAAPDALVHLSTAGCSVLVDLTEAQLPQVLHWGAALGTLDEPAARAVADAQRHVVGINQADVPVRLALLPEHHTRYTGRPGLSGSRDGRSWSTRFRVRSARLDGRDVASYTTAGPATLSVVAVDDEAALELVITLQLLASGLLRSRAAVTNLDVEPFQVDDLVLAYPVPASAAELMDFAGRWGKERVPQRSAFDVGVRLRECRRGRTGADSAFVLHAGASGFGFGRGEVWGVHTAWSGNSTHYAERTFDGVRLIGGGELLLSGEVRLEQGESYRSPWVYGSYGVGLDESARRSHRYLRSRPQHVSTDRPVTLNVWEAVYFDHDLDVLLRLAERAREVGVERYVLDDGWFGSRRDDTSGLGDWFVSEDVWPDGLHPLVDRVTELGMQFGLWVEPEMVNPASELARAHPEWVMSARREWPVESRHQQVLDLAIPECYEHILGRLLAILDEYPIRFLKWDHNRDLVEAGDATRGHRPVVHEQTLAFYRMLAAIKRSGSSLPAPASALARRGQRPAPAAEWEEAETEVLLGVWPPATEQRGRRHRASAAARHLTGGRRRRVEGSVDEVAAAHGPRVPPAAQGRPDQRATGPRGHRAAPVPPTRCPRRWPALRPDWRWPRRAPRRPRSATPTR